MLTLDNLVFLLTRLLFISFALFNIFFYYGDPFLLALLKLETLVPILSSLPQIMVRENDMRTCSFITLLISVMIFFYGIFTLNIYFHLLGYLLAEAAILNHSFFRKRIFNLVLHSLQGILMCAATLFCWVMDSGFQYVLIAMHISVLCVLSAHMFVHQKEIHYKKIKGNSKSIGLLMCRNIISFSFRSFYIDEKTSQIGLFFIKFVNQLILFAWSFIRSTSGVLIPNGQSNFTKIIFPIVCLGVISGMLSVTLPMLNLFFFTVSLVCLLFGEVGYSARGGRQ
jgi:hypothetical protein